MTAFDVDALRARFPALVARAGRPAGRLLRRPRRHPGPAAGHRRGRALLPRLERERRRRVPRRAGGATRSSPRPTRRWPTCSARRAPTRSSSAPNMTTLTFHISRSIGATLAPGDEIVVTSLDHEATSTRGGRCGRDRGVTVRTVDTAARRLHARPRGLDDAARPADEARRGRLGLERGRDDQPGRGDRRAGARGGRLDLRRRGPAAPHLPDRRRGPSTPTSSPARPTSSSGRTSACCTARPTSSTRCRRTRSGRPTTGSRPGPRTSSRIAGTLAAVDYLARGRRRRTARPGRRDPRRRRASGPG